MEQGGFPRFSHSHSLFLPRTIPIRSMGHILKSISSSPQDEFGDECDDRPELRRAREVGTFRTFSRTASLRRSVVDAARAVSSAAIGPTRTRDRSFEGPFRTRRAVRVRRPSSTSLFSPFAGKDDGWSVAVGRSDRGLQFPSHRHAVAAAPIFMVFTETSVSF